MSYVKAEEILPKELIETIQQYVSGEIIYIPCKEKKDWGSQTETKQYYKTRNLEICTKYRNGVSTKILAREYSLSEKSIYRILRTTKSEELVGEVI
ncbi:MAG: CD3324 family protein [Agathobacter sp.]|nr:CD3324 family protein [Agathobacter sp.]